MMAALRARLAERSAAELARLMEEAALPFAPIRRPEDLYDDPHLQATGGLAPVRVPDGPKAGQSVGTTLLPLTLAGRRLPVRLDPPRRGEHTREVLAAIGFDPAEIDALQADRVVA
jgi:crotonobetainyl-CoA:carnitine CoA-transferase CaiB-like acyl-CoA transferase